MCRVLGFSLIMPVVPELNDWVRLQGWFRCRELGLFKEVISMLFDWFTMSWRYRKCC